LYAVHLIYATFRELVPLPSSDEIIYHLFSMVHYIEIISPENVEAWTVCCSRVRYNDVTRKRE